MPHAQSLCTLRHHSPCRLFRPWELVRQVEIHSGVIGFFVGAQAAARGTGAEGGQKHQYGRGESVKRLHAKVGFR